MNALTQNQLKAEWDRRQAESGPFFAPSAPVTIKEDWEKRQYGSKLARRVMTAYMNKLKEANQAAHPKRLVTFRANQAKKGKRGNLALP